VLAAAETLTFTQFRTTFAILVAIFSELYLEKEIETFYSDSSQ